MKKSLTIVKVGGNIIDDDAKLKIFLPILQQLKA